ncbi:MAG: CCA tRNA nucleotidyltransferase [Clostridia bacterium]|nr:CCA tRNA nucleotidyltransferase [Clostridia bacterium]
MNFPEYVSFTLKRLEENGYSAYLVGGCVRDFIMGIEPHDFDITTSASPDEIERCFCDIKTLDVGKKHGTITLVFEKECVEVTTYRIDGEYRDLRHPESVTFTDKIEEDLARRDFTMNAIAFSPIRGFVDPFFGREDIQKKRIVAVGEAEKRFCEDALRLLRALRFSSRLGFEIEENTKKAIFEKKQLLGNIAMERINAEFCGILEGRYAAGVMAEFFDCLCAALPNITPVDEVAIERAFDFCLMTKLCVFFSGLCDVKTLSDTLKHMKFDNNTVKCVTTVLPLVGVYTSKTDDADIKKAVSKIGAQNAEILYNTLYCLHGDKTYLASVEKLYGFIKNGECMTVQGLCIKGNEIIDLYKINPAETGGILSSLLCDVIEGKTPNEKNALIDRAKMYI